MKDTKITKGLVYVTQTEHFFQGLSRKSCEPRALARAEFQAPWRLRASAPAEAGGSLVPRRS